MPKSNFRHYRDFLDFENFSLLKYLPNTLNETFFKFAELVSWVLFDASNLIFILSAFTKKKIKGSISGGDSSSNIKLLMLKSVSIESLRRNPLTQESIFLFRL